MLLPFLTSFSCLCSCCVFYLQWRDRGEGRRKSWEAEEKEGVREHRQPLVQIAGKLPLLPLLLLASVPTVSSPRLKATLSGEVKKGNLETGKLLPLSLHLSSYIGILRCIVLCFTALHKCCVFYTWKASPSTSKKIITSFIVVLTLLPWSGTEPPLFLSYACASFIVAVWNWTCNNSEVYRCFPTLSDSLPRASQVPSALNGLCK